MRGVRPGRSGTLNGTNGSSYPIGTAGNNTICGGNGSGSDTLNGGSPVVNNDIHMT